MKRKETHPMISYGKVFRDDEESHTFVRKIVQKVLKDYFPQETFSNSMTIPPLSPTILFRPNNYRLGVRFPGRSNRMLGVLSRHTNLLFWRKGNITVQVGRDKIVGIWNQGKDRQTWDIRRDSMVELEDRLNIVKDDIMLKIKLVVQEYADLSGIELFGNFFWVRHEDWVKGEEYIDKIPKEFVIHDSVFKKVYNDRGIEFIGGKDRPGTFEVKQYIKNRVIEDFAPEIVKELTRFNDNIKDLRDVTLLEIENKKIHLSVLNDMKSTQKAQIKVLSKLHSSINLFNSPLRVDGGGSSVGVRSFESPSICSSECVIPQQKNLLSKDYRIFRARKLLEEYGW